MKGKALIPLMIGLVAGVFAIKYSMDAVKSAKGATNTETVSVVVALSDIPATVAIDQKMLIVKETPKTPLLPKDAFAKPEDLVGRVALKSIPQGTPVLPSMIAPEGTVPGLLTRVKTGYRAVAVKIDESSGVGYLVRPNDWVDVLVVMDVRKGNKKETISRVILQRVQVGAVGQVLGYEAEEGAKQARTITLLVKEEDVPKLHLAQTKGRITLAMRGTSDGAIAEAAEATESEVLGRGAPARQTDAGEKDAGPSFLESLVQAMAAAQAQPPAVEEEPCEVPEPFTVLVLNGSDGDYEKGKLQRITYRDEQSMDVLAVSDKPTADANPEGQRRYVPGSPNVRSHRPRTREEWLLMQRAGLPETGPDEHDDQGVNIVPE